MNRRVTVPMKLEIRDLLLVLVAAATLAPAQDGWQAVPQHPQVRYRVTCSRGSGSIKWHNSYPGTVKLRAEIKSYSYDGPEDVQIGPNGEAVSMLETVSCDPLHVNVVHFSMAAPPRPIAPPAAQPTGAATKPAAAAAPAPVQPPAVPALLTFDPPSEPVREVGETEFASIKPGMTLKEVLDKLGPPISRIAIPDDNGLKETLRYNIAHQKTGVIRFSNGTATEIVTPI
jgi:hypothetical protein